MTTMLLYQNENLLIDFHYNLYNTKVQPTSEFVGGIFIHTDCWIVISVMINGKLKRVTEHLDLNVKDKEGDGMSSFDTLIVDEDGKEYIVSIPFHNIDTILRVFTQIGYELDTPSIYKKMREYVELVTTNYLNPQNQRPVDHM